MTLSIKQTLYAALGLVMLAAPVFAVDTDFAQDVSIFSDPSPRDLLTGSSLNQFGAGETDSQVDNYVNQDEQINLTEKSGVVKVLRTNQKIGINTYITALIEVKNVNPRELRGLARTICRKEGGDADVLHDKVNLKEYVVVVCPEFQLPYLVQTIQALDHEWIAEVNDGSWEIYYEGQHRDVRNMMDILQLYRSPDGVWDFDDANNAVLFNDQPCIEPLFRWGTETVDIDPNQLTLDVAIYEVDARNDLVLGMDWQTIKNGPNRDLFEFIFYTYNGDDPLGFFPGDPDLFADHGSLRSYNVVGTTAYLDFMQSKARARLLTKAMISAKSGSVAELAAVDQVLAFQADSSPESTQLQRDVPTRLTNVYEYYFNLGAVSPSLDVLLAQTPPTIISTITALLGGAVGVDADAFADIVDALNDKAADGDIDRGELDSIYVPVEVTLEVFRDRTLEYLKSGRTGVLLSILPHVGLESAETTIAFDVSDVVDYTPSGTPIIEHQYFSSVVELRNGHPLVLGGLKRTVDVKTTNGIPWLRDIPWLGYLFGREISVKREKNLVVILTPYFRLCPTQMVEPPEELQRAISLAKGEDVLEVPATPFGFDQWLLDPERRLEKKAAAQAATPDAPEGEDVPTTQVVPGIEE